MPILTVLIENHESQIPADRWASYVASVKHCLRERPFTDCSSTSRVTRPASAWVLTLPSEDAERLVSDIKTSAAPFETLSEPTLLVHVDPRG